MPFTVAHPAFVLPLSKKEWNLSLTALIAGSIVPDFEFFFQLREVENIGHHWYGILLFDVPVSLLFCFLFHNLLKRPFITNLPGPLKNRLQPTLVFDWNGYFRNNKRTTLLSLVLGIGTHLFWDGFTHADGLFVQQVALLSENLKLFAINLPVYLWLQIVLSITGLSGVGYWVMTLPERAINDTIQPDGSFWFILLAITASILSIRLYGWPMYNSGWGIVMAILGSCCYGLLLTSMVHHYSNLSEN